MGTKLRLGNASLTVAAFLMLLAGVWDAITLAHGDYRHVLLQALACVAVADVICIYQFVIRRGLIQWIAASIALSSSFIVPDMLRRLSG